MMKMAHFVPTMEKTLVEGLAKLFRDHVWKLHGLPESIVSDREAQLAAGLMRELNKILGIETKLSMAFHPQIDGQIERTNQELEQYLRMFIDHQQEQWLDWLGTAEFAYNNKVNMLTKVVMIRLGQAFWHQETAAVIEQSCQGHDMDIRQMDTRHILANRHRKYLDNYRVPSHM